MNKKEILEGNKLIAEFMGYTKEQYTVEGSSKEYDVWTNNLICKGCYYDLFDLKYHSSWDWLMPVVEKIQYDLGHFVTIERNSTLIHESKFDSKIINPPFGYGEQESFIQITYKAVVEFIKWYNKETNN